MCRCMQNGNICDFVAKRLKFGTKKQQSGGNEKKIWNLHAKGIVRHDFFVKTSEDFLAEKTTFWPKDCAFGVPFGPKVRVK